MATDPGAQRFLENLYQWGHFRNPAFPETQNVTGEDLAALDMADTVVKDAVKSYQEWFAGELDTQSRSIHGRPLIVDGDVGPATELVASQPRCGAPDYLGEGASEANWPQQCRLEITVSYELGALNMDAQSIRLEWERALGAWEKVIGVKFAIQDTFSQSTRIWARAKALPGSTLAWSFLAQNDCSARLEQAYDTTTSWRPRFLQATIGHEVGHALGAGHSRNQRALMWPSITDIVEPQQADVAAMRALGYGEPVPPQQPQPPPAPPGTPVPGRGTFTTLEGVTYNLIGIKAN
jgi:hypothetical protein